MTKFKKLFEGENLNEGLWTEFTGMFKLASILKKESKKFEDALNKAEKNGTSKEDMKNEFKKYTDNIRKMVNSVDTSEDTKHAVLINFLSGMVNVLQQNYDVNSESEIIDLLGITLSEYAEIAK